MKIYEGQKVPFWYGYSWRNYDSRSIECYFIPFNFIFRFLRYVWGKGMYHKVSAEDIAFENGYELGKKETEEKYKNKYSEIGQKFLETFTPIKK